MSGANTFVRGLQWPALRHAAAAPRAALSALDARLAAERGRLAPWLAVALGAGSILYFALPEEPAPGWRWLAPVLLVAALRTARRHPRAGWVLGLVAAGALGAAAASWHAARQAPLLDLPSRAVVITGVVQQVDLLPNGRRVTLAEARLAPDAPALPRMLRVRLRSNDPARPAPGDRLQVRALVRAPMAPAYPGGWDFQRAAYFEGLGGYGFAIGPALVVPGSGSAPLLSGTRAMVEARVTSAIPGAAGAVAAALLTGGQSAIPPEDLAAMRDSGLAHLLSVSGVHIAIVMGVSFAVVRFLIACWPWLALRVPGKQAAAVIALGAGGFYMLLTGAEVPMQRSFAMAALVTLGLILGRRALSLRGLALAAAVVLLLRPDAVLGPSFQMSFAAVLVLIAGWEWVRPRLAAWRGEGEWWRRAVIAVAGAAATSVLAGAATTPFGLHHFGRLQIYGVLANAVAVPLTSVLVMPAGMLSILLMPLGLDGPALLVMGLGVEAILAVARFVAAWPAAAPMAPPIPSWGLGVLSFGLVWLCLWRTDWRFLGVPLVAAGLATSLLHGAPDVLVSHDARLIALRTEDGLFLHRVRGASSLTREIWLRSQAEEAAKDLPEDGAVAGGAIACSAGACRLQPRADAAAAILLRGGAAAEACGQAAVVLSPEPVRGTCAGSAVVDRFAVWRDGPHAVWLERQGARVMSDRAWRGQRPWVPPPPRPRSERRGAAN